MPEVTKYEAGAFCWVELSTTDPAAAKQFYTTLFDWTSEDTPAGPDMVYTMLQLEGKEIGALYEQPEEQRSQGIPPNWLSYVSVADADTVASKAQSLGGTVLRSPFDVFDVGRMAVIQDLEGASFAIWQPKAHIGARLINQPGSFCWNELHTAEKTKAREFYTKLFGWTAKEDAGDPVPYTEWINGTEPIGGMIEIQKEWGNVPPHWMPYFAVTDCDGTSNKAKSLGASIKVPPTDIPNVGRFSVIQDPQGAVFAIIKLTQ